MACNSDIKRYNNDPAKGSVIKVLRLQGGATVENTCSNR